MNREEQEFHPTPQQFNVMRNRLIQAMEAARHLNPDIMHVLLMSIIDMVEFFPYGRGSYPREVLRNCARVIESEIPDEFMHHLPQGEENMDPNM